MNPRKISVPLLFIILSSCRTDERLNIRTPSDVKTAMLADLFSPPLHICETESKVSGIFSMRIVSSCRGPYVPRCLGVIGEPKAGYAVNLVQGWRSDKACDSDVAETEAPVSMMHRFTL